MEWSPDVVDRTLLVSFMEKMSLQQADFENTDFPRLYRSQAEIGAKLDSGVELVECP